ncbi:methyltransferase type 11 [Candidatus Vecturithrix granuli]|uniref:Methyltransferase type 11 n=1 Tax=Vecturithrix granuli TaxID=1499967 RepID=A0A081C5M5_VECG1|nr:methyltransferase type 11 [Candidatus Vecturithrix granuli]
MTAVQEFWEQAAQVERFAAREPDRRLTELLRLYPHPQEICVLDLGCAGGRNTVLLAEQGFDVYALDASFAMVAKTRERTAAILGVLEAERRIHPSKMSDLRPFDSESFDLIVALGIYHNAASQQEWECTLNETARVLKPHGLVLVSNFSPQSDPQGAGLRLVPGETHVYEGFGAGPMWLLDADDLDAEMARVRLVPVIATQTVFVKTDEGHRVTINALYHKM